MQILYNTKTDLLYLRLDDRKQELVNKRVSEDVVLDASKHVNLERLLPVKSKVS